MKTIAWVIDERLSRERAKRLTSFLQKVKAAGAALDILPGDLPEAQLAEQLSAKPYTALFLPAHRALALALASAKPAPPMVGYHCEGLSAKDLAPAQGRARLLILDLSSGRDETLRLLLSLTLDATRTGIRPLLDPDTTIHAAQWGPAQAVGPLIDGVPALSEISRTDWARRTPAVRFMLTALWSLVYEHGSGKNPSNPQGSADASRAQLQFAADAQTLVLRLLTPVPAGQHSEFHRAFWPGARPQFHPAQVLLRASDFVRVCHWQEGGLTEVTVGLLGPQETELPPDSVRTLLLDFVPEQSVVERPLDLGNLSGNVKRLGAAEGPAAAVAAAPAQEALLPSAAKRFLGEASAKIRQLRSIIADKEAIIQELRSGGVGTAQALPPLEPEDLLESFQERYFQAKLQIRQLEAAVERLMSEPGATQQEIEAVKLRMERLMQRQEAWTRAIHRVVEQGKERKKAGR